MVAEKKSLVEDKVYDGTQNTSPHGTRNIMCGTTLRTKLAKHLHEYNGCTAKRSETEVVHEDRKVPKRSVLQLFLQL